MCIFTSMNIDNVLNRFESMHIKVISTQNSLDSQLKHYTCLSSSCLLQGAYKNDFLGLEFEPMFAGEPKMTGEEVIQKIFGVKVTHSKWWDLAAIVLILVCYRILFFIVLKLKERAEPALKALQAKRTMRSLNKRPSFRKVPSLSSLSSRRHQALHSLSSQEGLTSPIH